VHNQEPTIGAQEAGIPATEVGAAERTTLQIVVVGTAWEIGALPAPEVPEALVPSAEVPEDPAERVRVPAVRVAHQAWAAEAGAVEAGAVEAGADEDEQASNQEDT
jgi:hypothetical protein